MPRYMDVEGLLVVPNVRKVTEFDEAGYSMSYLAVPLAAINAAPTIDAVEVVRCKDCKLFMEYTELFRGSSGYDGACRILAGYTDCDREMRKYMDYCSYGEPREDTEVEG